MLAHINKQMIKPCISLFLAALVVHFAASASPGATWNGGGAGNNWQDPNNWGGTAPNPNEDLFFDGNLQLTNNNDFPVDTAFNSLNFNPTAGAFVLGGHEITLNNGIFDNASGTPQIINLPIVLTNTNGPTQNIDVTSGGSLQIGGVISGAGGINVDDLGTLTLTGANTYSGPTNIGTTNNSASVVVGVGGTLGNGTSALTLGGINTATIGSLDLTNASATVSSLTVSSNTSSANTITIGSGQTLTVNGNTTIGGNPTVSAATISLLQLSGGGTLQLGNGSGGTLTLNNFTPNNGANTTNASIDASSLTNFTANYGSTGTITIGAYYGTSTTSGPYGSLILGTNNKLVANTLNIGQNLGGASGTHSTGNRSNGFIKLGTTNQIFVNNINLGGGKPSAPSGTAIDSITFNNPSASGQSVTFRGADGTSPVASIKIADDTLYDSNSGTAGQGTMDFTGGTLDMSVTNLQIGLGKSGANSAATTGILTFNAGTINATTIALAARNAAPAATTGTINVNGTGILNAGTIKLGDISFTPSTGTATGNLNINSGTVNMSGNITSGGGVANVNLSGGTLNMQGHNFVAGTSNVLINAASGTLMNVGQINGGGSNGLTKALTGTVTLSGTNTYTGPTNINAGTLSVLSAVPGTDNVNSGGILAGTGNGGNVVLNSGGKVYPGLVAGDISSLSANSLSVTGGALNIDLGSSLTSDLFSITGVANFTGSSIINIVNTPPTTGVYTVLNAGTLTLGTLPGVVGPNPAFLYTLDTSDPHKLKIDVTVAPVPLTWTGSQDQTTWDIGGKTNWSNGTNSVTYTEPALVTFDDSAPANATNITLNTTVAPNTVTFNGSVNAYTISGTGSIGGGAQIIMNSSTTLTLLTNNTYSGQTVVNAGTIQVGNGGTTGSLGTGPVTNNGVIAFNRTDTVTVPGDISGSGEIQQNGTGTVILAGNNTYTTTTINAGTLQVGTGGANGSVGTGAVNDNGTLVINRSGAFTFANTVSGSGGLTQMGSATITYTGNNSYSGNTTLSGGTAIVSTLPNGNSGIGTGGIVFDGGTLQVVSTGNQTSGRNISLTSNGGTIDASPINSDSLTLNGTFAETGAASTTLTLTGTDPSTTNPTFNGMNLLLVDPSSGTLSIVKNGPNGWSLGNASSTFTGTITINAGVLRTGASPSDTTGPFGNNTAGIAPNISVANGAQVRFNNAGTYNNNISIAGVGIAGNELQSNYGAIYLSASGVTVAGTVTLTGDARITGRGATGGSTIGGQITGPHALEIGKSGNGTNIVIISNTANNWTGNTTISMGVTRVGGESTSTAGVIPHGPTYGNVIINGGDALNDNVTSTLDLNGFDLVINGLSASGDTTKDVVTDSAGANTLSVGDNNQTAAYAGVITGGVSLNKIGTGVQTLSGTNTYNGLTTVSNGTLALNKVNSISNTSGVILGDAVNLTSGTLATSGLNQDVSGNNGTLTLANSSSIDLGAGSSTLKFANSSSTMWTSPALLTINNWTFGSDHLFVGGDNTGLTSAQLSEIKFADFAPGASISSISNSIVSPGEVTPLIGDINQDSHVDVRDVAALMQALANPTAYAAAHPSLTSTDIKFLLDVDGDGSDTNADIQSLLNYLIAGNGSTSPVPEPSSLALLGLCGLIAVGMKRKQKKLTRALDEKRKI